MTCPEGKLHGIWTEFHFDGVDREKFHAKRVCHYCQEVTGMEPLHFEPTIINVAVQMAKEGRLTDWEKTIVLELHRRGNLDDREKRVVKRIISERNQK